MDNLIAFVEDEEAKAETESVEADRQKALQYYQPNKPLGNEVAGRSQVVMRDVLDTVEWMKPSLLKTFVSGDEVVKFTPRGPEDVEGAQQETEYVNHIITDKNNAFLIFHDWFTDALLSQNGYVKVLLEDEPEQVETYAGMSEDELTQLQAEWDIVAAEPDSFGTYTVKLKRKQGYKCVKIDNLRPESVRISADHRGVGLQDARFVRHGEYRTLSALREMGLEVDDDINDAYGDDWTGVDSERRDRDNWGEENTNDPASREVFVREVWAKYDRNGDGISERIHAIIVGREILLEEPAECVPIACITPIRVPHRHNGISIADLVMEICEIRTTLMRNALDQQYLRNHGRHAIDVNRVNLDDMLVSRPGGIVRVNGDVGSAIFPLVNPQGGGEALQMIEFMDTVRENRTGITKYNQGMDSQSLNKTATGVNAIQNAAQQRTELIARMFAETGVKELFWLVHFYSFKYVRKPQIIRLRNKFVSVDPTQWSQRNDMTISVGLGMGNKDQQAQQLQMLLQFMGQGMQLGIVTPQNMYHAAKQYIQSSGFKDVENWLTEPSQQPQEPPPDPAMEKVKQEGQIKQAQMQQEAQIEQAKIQSESQLKQQEVQADIALKQWEAQQKMALEEKLAMMKLETEREIAMMREAANVQQQQHQMMLNEQSAGNEHSRELAGLLENAKGAQASEQMQVVMKGLEALISQSSKPKRVVRDESGRVAGIE